MDERLLRLSQSLRHLLAEAERLHSEIGSLLVEADEWRAMAYVIRDEPLPGMPPEPWPSIKEAADWSFKRLQRALVDTYDAAEAFDAIDGREFLKMLPFYPVVTPATGIKEFVEKVAKALADDELNDRSEWEELSKSLDPIIFSLRSDRRDLEETPALHRYYADKGLQGLRRKLAGYSRETASDGPNDGPVDQPLGNGEAEPQPSASANGATVPKPLKGKYAKALEIIKAKPSRKAVAIANEIGVGVEGFMSRYVPRLREHGVYNDGDGYCWKPPCDSPPSAT